MRKITCILSLMLATVGSAIAQEPNPDSFIEIVSPDARPEIESQVFHLINDYRKSRSLPPFKWSSLPAHYARQHSLDMARGIVPFGHNGFYERFYLLRAAMPSLTSMGENVAFNRGFSNPPQVAVDSWLSSPGHLANIEGDYNLAGVGVGVNSKGEYYFTQIFAKTALTSEGRVR
jgi:uncharacterized protein YkwD